MSPVSYSELLNVVSKQKCKKLFDYHGLNMWIIKKIIISVIEPFMHICNLSFSKGIFPLQMKMLKLFLYLNQVISLNLTTIFQYQCFLSFKNLFYERLKTYIDKHVLLSDNQYGFRSNRSTSLALLELVEKITKSIDDGKYTIGIFYRH